MKKGKCYICDVVHLIDCFFTGLSDKGRKLCSLCQGKVQNIWMDKKAPYFSFDSAIDELKNKR